MATRPTVKKRAELNTSKKETASSGTEPPLLPHIEKTIVAATGRRAKKTIRILSCGAKGGPGKTFFCKNLAGAAAAEGYRVAVVDFDTQRTLSNWLQRRERKSADKAFIEGFAASPRECSGRQ